VLFSFYVSACILQYHEENNDPLLLGAKL
jgi:hypothetical protein